MPEKICLQQKYPHLSTPCYEAAGSKPCNRPVCQVLQLVKLLKAMTGEKVTAGELRELFHTQCQITSLRPDSQYWPRVSQRLQDESGG